MEENRRKEKAGGVKEELGWGCEKESVERNVENNGLEGGRREKKREKRWFNDGRGKEGRGERRLEKIT